MSTIYLDHAATTPLSSSVLEEMMPYLTELYGNASALYRQGQVAREALDFARFSISQNIGCEIDEIIFTSGATESNNLALRGVLSVQAEKMKAQNMIPHVITTQIEHSTVQSILHELIEKGEITCTFLEVDTNGFIDIDTLKSSIQENTVLISIIAVNNEIGSIQPLSRIGRICKKQNIVFHVDAVQAVGQIEVSCENWKCDLLALSAHKFYGPKGVGLLMVASGTEMNAVQVGGGQERSYRGGTENVAGIVGMMSALSETLEDWEEEKERLQGFQEYTKKYIETHVPWALWNGAGVGESRSTANCNFSFPGVDGESMLMRLDLEGIAVSLGSACSAGMMNPSHVLLALGRDADTAKNALRITFGKGNTQSEVEEACEKIVKVVHALKK